MTRSAKPSLLILAVVTCALVRSSIAMASDVLGSGGLVIGLAAEVRAADALSIGDIHPQTRQYTGAQLDVLYVPRPGWALGAFGRFGGTWFDFNGPGVSGNIEDTRYGFGASLDRTWESGPSIAFMLGAGFEYNEARSWVHNLTQSDAGPHTYLAGAFGRVGLVKQIGERFQLVARLEHSTCHAHAKDFPTGSEYNWLANSLAASLGVHAVLLRGHSP